MRCAVFTTIPPGCYSGGRYHADIMAEALANGGHQVHLVVNDVPAFWDDFSVFPAHGKVRISFTNDFASNLPPGSFNIVVMVPGMPMGADYFCGVQQFAADRGAHLVFLNFESGNWFNSLSPEPRDITLWDQWKDAAQRASLVLSSAKESDKWARLFYTDRPPNARFDYCYPAIVCVVRVIRVGCFNYVTSYVIFKKRFIAVSVCY